VAVGFVGGVALMSGGGTKTIGRLHDELAVPEARAQEARPPHSYADVAEMVMPAVVNISTDKVVETTFRHPFFDDPFFRRFFDMPDEDNQRGQNRVEQSLGSGIVISSDGYILTNHHVVAQASKIRVSFSNREEFEAETVGSDPRTDIALIRIVSDDDLDLPFLTFADSDFLRIGDEVLAVGNPFGVGQTVTKGIVSALGRSIGLIDYEDLIQTDATINPGNSGGPLVDLNGQVVGMSTAILSRSGGSQGIGFAIPSDMAERIVGELKEHGEVKRAWIGVTIRDVDQTMADVFGMERPRGVLINSVQEDTPAEKAGLKAEDIILSVDGNDVNSVSELRNKISLMPVGKEVELRVLRDGHEITKTVKLEALPEQETLAQAGAEEEGEGIPGVTVAELTERRRAGYDIPQDVDGLVVVDIVQGSAAWQEGLREGDVIVELNRGEVTSLRDYREQVQKNEDRPFYLRVYRPGQNGAWILLAIPR
jgi:Do/DeqQ family serine protease